MQLLAEIDGFKPLDNVKIIGCTNRKDILDAAILRPGRLDRRIYVPLPDEAGRREILKIHTKNLNMHKINTQELVLATDSLSGAEIKSVVTEAGYFAIRDNRTKVTQEDFNLALEKVRTGEPMEDDYSRMFG
jgi:proteasome regulatory subunit